MNLFEYTDYKKYVNKWVLSKPKAGRGLYRQISMACSMSTVLVSQVFKGERELTLDQAHLLTDFMALTEDEARYFMLLVQKIRAGSVNYKNFLSTQIKELQENNKKLSQRIKKQVELDDRARSIFYSDWIYSAIRLLSSIDGYQDIDSIAKKLGLQRERTKLAVDFLIQTGLCKLEDGEIRMGVQRTFLEADSPLIKARQISWRVKGFESMDQKQKNSLYFTAPVSIAKKDVPQVRKILVDTIEKISYVVEESPEEDLACLNIDWFQF